ncbi:hemoglobin subunit beta-1-like [Salarias fasciatus]|uniref:Hemoglobin subunit beta-1-like n=1 Tax=Salarias fasciatus TaxID=181472 RepID=A0A672GVQ8_SALFA|nr:hemoglobin subunit beta-1-like [Salarias fasciatus]
MDMFKYSVVKNVLFKLEEETQTEANMVDWSDKERSVITNLFSNLDNEDIGAKALSRCLIVNASIRSYFTSFGDLSSNEAIASNPKVAAHGAKILQDLSRAVKNVGNVRAASSELSALNSDKQRADSTYFTLFSDSLSFVFATEMGSGFTIETQAAFKKFMAEVLSALGTYYY